MKTQITLRLKEQPSIPIEAESIIPENLSGKSLAEINSLPLWCGNRQEKVEDYFTVEISELDGDSLPADSMPKMVLQGNLSRFKRLGQGMSAGEMEIQGSAGFHAGALMRGGTLVIKGNAQDWLGAQMEGGQISVEGSAGNFVGAAYRGRTQGMSGGTILIKGNAGQMVGSKMRRGLIAVGGDCGDVLGYKMLAGTILVAGRTGIRVGANMERGTVILLNPSDLLPSFYFNCCYQPEFWRLLYKELQSKGFNLNQSLKATLFKHYSGDGNEGAKGEVLICQSI
ncbi:MAG: formylmethanofuran dehydrogenase subunit C [Peptococcaceae bacterium]|nr:formylmethanofuran dehydrogenase subunit C [Peptococcaceae bacterium]